MQEKEVWELIPQKLVEELTGEQLALVASAINQSYHNGKAAAGSEVVDEGDNYGAVYVNCIGKMIEWEKAGENLNFFAK